MRKVLVGLGIVLCAFGVVMGVMIKTNPELRSAYHKYRDLFLQTTQVPSPLTSGSWSAMTGWEQVLKMIDIENLDLNKAEALVYGMFPVCESPSMVTDQTPIVIWEHIKNCTQKKKQWKMFDWLGWACFPYFIYNVNLKSLLAIRPCDFDALDILSWVKTGIKSPFLCKTIKKGELEWGLPIEDSDSDLFYSWWIKALETVLSTWLLESMWYWGYDYPQLIRSSQDQDTEIMYWNSAWWDDEGNYFVAGEDYKGEFLYAINGKLYYPRAQVDKWFEDFSISDFETGKKLNSEWFFGGFRWKTPLVKRVLNFEKKYKNLTGDQSLDANYILETCELDS